MQQTGEIILYQPNENVQLEVRLEEETVWLTQQQMTLLFETTKQNVSLHINNIFKEEELSPISTVKEYLTVHQEGKATIYTKQISPTLQNDINLHNAQYKPIDVQVFAESHDRFLMIDETVYHIGASLKDLGKKWFAFSKMEINSTTLLSKM